MGVNDKKNLTGARAVVPFAVATLLVAAAVTACEMERLLPYGGGRTDGLEVPISRLRIDRDRIITVLESDLQEQLGLEIFPPHTTMSGKVEWLSSDYDAVFVDQSGNIHVHMDALRADDAVFAEVTITARFTENHSIFSEMTVMILPEFPRYRELIFNNWGTAQISGTPIAQLENIANRVNLEGDWHMGDGIILLTGTGDVATEDLTGRATDIVLQADTENAADNPWIHTAAFLIGSENLHDHVPRSTGGGRALGSWHADGEGGNLHVGTGQPWNDPRRTDLSDPWGLAPDPTRWGHLRTAGAGMRVFQVLGLQRPFEIEMRYVTNSANTGRWAGIRFGGDEGDFWVEGPMSWQTASAGGNTGRGRVLRFEFRDYLYSYNRDASGNAFREWILEDGSRVPIEGFNPAAHPPRIPLDDFLPITNIYAFEGLRIHDLVIRPLETSPGILDWGERPPQ